MRLAAHASVPGLSYADPTKKWSIELQTPDGAVRSNIDGWFDERDDVNTAEGCET